MFVQVRRHRWANRRNALVALLALALVGLASYIVYAAPKNLETESGTRSGNAVSISDSSASGNQAIRFGTDESSLPAGLFITRGEMDRAKVRAAATTNPYRNGYNTLISRADAVLNRTPNPFYISPTAYQNDLYYGWSWSSCPDNNTSDDSSLADAVAKLQDESDDARTLALAYAITGTASYGNKARDFLAAWANGSTPVNMYDFFVNTSTFDGGLVGDDGTTCFRPWNMALDANFQGYGLLQFADAYILLTQNGYSFSGADNTAIRNYIYALAAAVNSGHHAWTRWADHHTGSSSYVRYRSDNHLSWGLAPILAAAAALGNQTIANYVLSGSSWNDGRSGNYSNPSSIRNVIDRAVLSNGRIYDEAPEAQGGAGRAGYAFFHLWAMEMTARIAEVHYPSDNIWGYKGSDGRGLEEAYATESDKVLGGSESGSAWQYELVYNRWPTTTNLNARNVGARTTFVNPGYGPITLLLGQ